MFVERMFSEAGCVVGGHAVDWRRQFQLRGPITARAHGGTAGLEICGITLATRPHFLAACDGDLLVQRIVPDACGVEDSIAPGVNDERLPHVRRREGASEWEGNGDHVNEARATFTAAARDDVDSSTFLLLPTRIRRRPLARKNASQTIAYYTSGTVRNTPALPPASAQGEKPGGGGS